MSPRAAHRGRLAAIVGVLTLALAACGNASPATSPSASAAQPTFVLPSGLVIPSFKADLDLEAQLPNDFCGQKTTKASFSGAEFLANDATFAALVQVLGRSAADVSVATAGVAGPECLGINLFALRIKGADTSKFEQLFLAVQAKDGTPTTKTNVGGKDVWTYTDDVGTNYLYFKGDIAFGVTAQTTADAAKGVAVMP
jgi:hypothetical protein